MTWDFLKTEQRKPFCSIGEDNLDLFNEQVKGNFYSYLMYTSILEKKLKSFGSLYYFGTFNNNGNNRKRDSRQQDTLEFEQKHQKKK